MKHPSAKRVHRCDVCKRGFVWSRESRVFGSLLHEDNGFRQFLICSARCEQSAPDAKTLARIVGKVSRKGGLVPVLEGAHWEEWDKR